MGVFFLIRFSLIGPYQRAVDDSIERTAQYESLLVETQKGIITLKANNMEQARDAVMDKSQREHIAGLMRKERLLARFDVASLLVIMRAAAGGLLWRVVDPGRADEHRDALRLYQL
jgi:ATP-binding cassette subfamily B protein RaxB